MDFSGILHVFTALNKYDLLPRINAPLKFSESFKKRTVFAGNGLEISVISREDLIEDEKTIGRPKDLSDIEYLKGLPPLSYL